MYLYNNSIIYRAIILTEPYYLVRAVVFLKKNRLTGTPYAFIILYARKVG